MWTSWKSGIARGIFLTCADIGALTNRRLYDSLMISLLRFVANLKAAMSRHFKQIAAGFLFVFVSISVPALAQGSAASGIDPAVLAKATSGDAASQFLVGLDYQNGDVVPRDFAQAAAWYRKAADQGDARAQYRLGLFYERGIGVAQDDAQAAGWMRKAADQGIAEAQFHIGMSYSRGKGVPQDDAQAVAWLQKAAVQKNADAMVNLALLYAHGQGVAKDPKQSAALIGQAADLGSAEAQYQLGLEYEQGQGVKKDKAQAGAWYRKAADQGLADAQLNLARIQGSNRTEAYFWASLAARSLEGPELDKATYLRDTTFDQLKPAEKAEADRRLQQWRAASPRQP
jgi:TPR repeat protein